MCLIILHSILYLDHVSSEIAIKTFILVNGMGGGYGSELDDGGYGSEGGYTFEVGEGARGMEGRLGMEFGSGAEGKKRTIAVENDRYYRKKRVASL